MQWFNTGTILLYHKSQYYVSYQNERATKRVKNPEDKLWPISSWCTLCYTFLGGNHLLLRQSVKTLHKMILINPVQLFIF